MKIKFESNNILPADVKTAGEYSHGYKIIRAIFAQDGKYYPQLFLDDGYERIDISEGIDVDMTNKSKECMLCH